MSKKLCCNKELRADITITTDLVKSMKQLISNQTL